MNRKPHIILGIADSITSGAAIIIEGRVVAAVNEERLCRTKMAMGWPRLAIEEVLRIANVQPADVDVVAIATKNLYWRPEAKTIKGYFDEDWGISKNTLLRLASWGSRVCGNSRHARKAYYQLKGLITKQRWQMVRDELKQRHAIDAPVEFIDHHVAHAASAYYTSGRPRATVITLDGAGDNLAASVSRGEAGHLERVHSVDSYDSIGNFYSYITQLLGFKAHQHEGKVTGLAAYGEPKYVDDLRRLICYANGSMHNRAKAFHTSAIKRLKQVLPSGAKREDVAASIQAILEEVCTQYVQHWVDRVGHGHLAVAGGVVANVKLNQRLLALPNVESIWVHPGMGDDGLAVGAALYKAAMSLPEADRESAVHSISDAYFGPEYSDREIRTALDNAGVRYHQSQCIAEEVADALVRHQVVARFDGRMEYGPRALGNRSILVHAGDPSVNDWLNKRLERTEFMPFAPVTLEEEAGKCYLDLGGAQHTARFMTITSGCTQQLQDCCPAVVHIDGTARPQLVGHQENSDYRAILEAYQTRTGYSTIINTSFNMHEEPLVCTPENAIRAFTSGRLDLLAIGDYVVVQPKPASDQGQQFVVGSSSVAN